MRDQKKPLPVGSEGLITSKLKISSTQSQVKVSTPSASSPGTQLLPPVSSAKGCSGARKLSFSLSSEAGSRLENLNRISPAGLSFLGILSGNVADNKILDSEEKSVKCVTTNNLLTSTSVPSLSGKSIPSLIKVPVTNGVKIDSHSINGDCSISDVQHVFTTLAAHQRLNCSVAQASTSAPCPVTPSYTVLSNEFRTGDNAALFLQPNVVATTCEPVPVLPPMLAMNHAASSTSLFPFSSMTKVALTIKSSTPALSTNVINTVSPSIPQPSFARNQHSPMDTPCSNVSKETYSLLLAADSAKGKARNVAMTSPLLINLLKGNELANVAHNLPDASTPKRTRKKKMSSDDIHSGHVPDKVVKESTRPNKKKKLEQGSNGIDLHSTAPRVQVKPGLLACNQDAAVDYLKDVSSGVDIAKESVSPTNLSLNGSGLSNDISQLLPDKSVKSGNGIVADTNPWCKSDTASIAGLKEGECCQVMTTSSQLPLANTPTTNLLCEDSICNGQFFTLPGTESVSAALMEEVAQEEDLLTMLQDDGCHAIDMPVTASTSSILCGENCSVLNCDQPDIDEITTMTHPETDGPGSELADTTQSTFNVFTCSQDVEDCNDPPELNTSDGTGRSSKEPFEPKLISICSSSNLVVSSGASSTVHIEVATIDINSGG